MFEKGAERVRFSSGRRSRMDRFVSSASNAERMMNGRGVGMKKKKDTSREKEEKENNERESGRLRKIVAKKCAKFIQRLPPA